MSDGKITIDTEINSKGVEEGVKSVNNSLNKLKSAVNAIKGGAVIGAEVKALKTLTKGIQDTAQAYNVQLKAETLLKTSAQNNPYLNGESVKELENYASELQSISTVGDEALLPFMAQLASSGRTQAEIMDIMKASVDVASTGIVSLDQAVKGLNLSYSGSIGQLGQFIPQLKDMTAEELKNGDAVKKVKEQFDGMAKATASASGSYEQMKNAQGDFNEAVGKITKPAADLWNNFWKGWYEKGIERVNAIGEYLEGIGEKFGAKALVKSLNSNLKTVKDATAGEKYKEVYSELSGESAESLRAIEELLTSQRKRNENEEIMLQAVQQRLSGLKELEEAEKEIEEARKKRAENEAKRKEKAIELQEKENSVDQYKQDNQDALDAQLKKIEEEKNLREALGEKIDDEAYHQERLNAMMNSYVDLISESNGEVTKNNQLSKDRVAQMKEEAEAIAKSQKGTKSLQETAEGVSETFSQISDAVQSFSNSISSLNDALDESFMSQEADQLSALNQQYRDGEISYEEYIKAQEKLDKEYAEKKYKLEVAEWAMKLAQATASVAQGVASALAGTPPASYINAVTTAALGATEIASIVASKPQKGFASGGIVGATAGGDNTYGVVGLRNGEMILNAQQQKELWSMANGKGGNGGNTIVNIPIENTASDLVDVKRVETDNGYKLIIQKAVLDGLNNGVFNSGLKRAQSTFNGRNYTN